jgi:PIN domain
MSQILLLIDFENVHKVDISLLDGRYRAIIFVGANQNPPKAAKNKATAHRFTRVDFVKVEGTGRNALDFYIAFQLGRTFETAPDTEYIVLSKDKGYDPLLTHLNKNGLKCRRVNFLEELITEPNAVIHVGTDERMVCPRCKKASTIEHHGGRWCSNCGSFASPPDPNLLPSRQSNNVFSIPNPFFEISAREQRHARLPTCGWCDRKTDMSDGIYDDGEWMCGGCVAGYAR